MAVTVGTRSTYSVNFDGSNDYITFGNPAAIQALGVLSVACWVKPSGTGRGDIFAQWNGGGQYHFNLLQGVDGTGKFSFYGSFNGSAASSSGDSTTTLTPGTWYHIAGVADGSLLKIYVNGTLENSSAFAANLFTTSTADVRLGASYDANYAGLVDEAVVYGSALSATDIARLAAGTINPFALTPVAYWKLDDGTGTNAVDSSGNGYDGTLTGGPTWNTDTPAYLQDYGTSGYQSGVSSVTFDYRAGSGSDNFILVQIAILTAGVSVTNATVNGTTDGRLVAEVLSPVRVELWSLKNPGIPAGTPLAVAVTLSGAADVIVSTILFHGVDQTAPTEATASASALNIGAADATVNITTSTAGCYLADVVATDDTAITVGTGQTQTANATGANGSGGMSYKSKAVAGADTMYWTNVAALKTWAIAATAVRPVQASVAFMPKKPIILGQAIITAAYS